MRNGIGRIRGTALATCVLGAVVGLVPATAGTLEIGSDTGLCAVLRQAKPGDEIVLQPGDYEGGCVVRRGGLPGAPIVIRAADPEAPPRLTRPGAEVNMLEIRASDIVVRGLSFGPTVPDADGIRIIKGNHITIEECRFFEMGGIAVVANHTSLRDLTVRRNVIIDSTATAMYFGCHDGATCTVTGLVVEGNYIRNVTAPTPQVGYGIEVKLNSSGVIRDNVVVDTKGPGIMIYGARDLVTTNLLERNFVHGSRTSSGLVVGGGPAVLRNNIAAWNVEAGIGLENYGGRGLLRGITVVNNTVYANGLGGITVPAQGPLAASLLNNAAAGQGGTPALPAPRPGLRQIGNVDCSLPLCFTNPEGLDFSPFPGSLLTGPATFRATEAVPGEDYFGSPRRTPVAIGAIEKPGGSLKLGIKR